MPFSLSHFTQAAAKGLVGYSRGKIAGDAAAREARERDQEARARALELSLRTHSEQRAQRGEQRHAEAHTWAGEDRAQRTGQDADRRTRIAAAAAQIRVQYGANPRYKGITLLPDDELVREFGDLISNPQRFDRPGGDSPRRATTRQDLSSVERQVDDTRADLGRAERDIPTPGLMQRGLGAIPAEAARFTADSTAAAGRVNTLRARADSLGTVRDSLAADVQGRQFRRPAPAGAKSPADRWDQLVGEGMPEAEATRRVKQEFRLP